MSILIDKLVLSGGGVRGCIHLGVIKYLEEQGYYKSLKTIAGTSIGAFICLLICLGYSYDELEKIIKEFDYYNYTSFDFNELIENFGIDSFEKIYEYIKTLVTKKNLSTEITFQQLHEKSGIHLIINAICLNTLENIYFDYISHPQMPILIAVKASMAVPFAFSSVNYKNLTYIDGGLINNFPIDHDIFKDNPQTVLGINLKTSLYCSLKEIKSIDQYTIQVFKALYENYMKLTDHYQKSSYGYHIINIPMNKIGTFHFNLSHENKMEMIEYGYQKTRNYFEVDIKKPQSIPSLPPPSQSQTDRQFLETIRSLLDHKSAIYVQKLIDERLQQKVSEPVLNELKPTLNEPNTTLIEPKTILIEPKPILNEPKTTLIENPVPIKINDVDLLL
jgi:predicted acylesterase/phospholipase RssA